MKSGSVSDGIKSLVIAGLCVAFVLGFGLSKAEAYTVVTGPPALEQEFISDTTTYFNSILKVNPFASNTYSIQLLGEGEPVTVLGNSMDECIAIGFGNGMDSERYSNLKLIQDFQRVDIASGTCGGVAADSRTVQACQNVYNQIGNAITQRWRIIYSSSGSIVAP